MASVQSPPNIGGFTAGLINSPNFDGKGKRQVRSVKDAGQAMNLIRYLIQANRQRMIINSRIMAKYNAEKPYDQTTLEQEGLGWRSNFTTKPLPSMIEKVSPRFVDAINGMKYLTNATLPPAFDGATVKTESFRSGITKLIRRRKGWVNLLDDISQDNALFGFTVVGWLDKYLWFPRHFKQDDIFMTTGTRQQPSGTQIVVLRELFLPHELFEFVEDREAADTAGWNVPNVLTAVNEASPAQLRVNYGGSPEIWYQNMWRELNVGASFMDGARVIVCYSLLAREVDGKVSHYRLAGDRLDEIYTMEDKFDNMDEALAYFTFQKGNSTMLGSKGIGREIYEMAGMVDRCRNEIADRLILSGKTMIQGDLKHLNRFKMSVVGAAVLIGQGWNVLEQKFDGNVEAFMKFDAYMSLLVDQLIGAVSPPRPEGGEAFRSPAAWQLLASREEEGRDARISRFLRFFTDMIGTMTKRICDRETLEDDAKEFQKDMLKVMSREELEELAKQPVAETVRDLTPTQRQLVVQIATEKRGNPLYNQRQLEEEDLAARVGSDFAKKVLLPEDDPTEKAEQQRLQQMELNMLTNGQPVPVSPRDNHRIHLEMLMPVTEKMGSALAAGQADTASFEAVVAHINEHYNRALSQGVKKEELARIADFLKKAMPMIEQLKALDAKAQEVAQAGQTIDQEGQLGGPLSVMHMSAQDAAHQHLAGLAAPPAAV